jgi:F-type H+-transporting ATPase subunit gamma
MLSEESLKRKIQSVESLQSVVKTMKALAAVKIRQYERAVASLAHYTTTVEMGLQVALRDRPGMAIGSRPAPKGRMGAVVFGSDRGMCGQLNDQVTAHALSAMQEFGIHPEERFVLAVGARAADRLTEGGQAVESALGQAGSVAEITAKVYDLLVRIEAWNSVRGIEQVYLFHARLTSGASYRPHRVHLLPVDRQWLARIRERTWEGRSLPAYSMEWDSMFSALIRQYLFSSVFRAFAESLASENASRLSSMQGAEKSIREMLADLNHRYRNQRQAAITEELLDIVAGFEALKE